MKSRSVKHFITGAELTAAELRGVLQEAKAMKENPTLYRKALADKSLAMIFEKPSFRTRLSFAMAIKTMGGFSIESVSNTRKPEEPSDMARVLNGYADLVMIRTHAESILEEMAQFSKIPIINGLSALHHPCQILADLLSLEEHFGSLAGLTLTYIGDGNNILNSFLLLAPQLGLKIHYSCPSSKQPNESILKQAKIKTPLQVQGFSTPEEAVINAHAVYTDVWTSMGFEDNKNETVFEGFQVNEALMAHAKPEAVFMHCMPMERGKEVSTTLPDSTCSIIFHQSENRMHVQKALMVFLSNVDCP